MRCHTPFQDLVGIDLTSIMANRGYRDYERGEMIYRADEHARGVYCIHEGVVKIYKLGRDGSEYIVRLAQSGDIMGYQSLLSGETYGVYAEPFDHARVCHISGTSLLPFLSSNYSLASRVLQLLASDLKLAEERLVRMAQRSARERLAEALLMIKQTCTGTCDQSLITISRGELASLVSVALESVSRQLSRFREEGVIELVGRKIRILDERALLNIAGTFD